MKSERWRWKWNKWKWKTALYAGDNDDIKNSEIRNDNGSNVGIEKCVISGGNDNGVKQPVSIDDGEVKWSEMIMMTLYSNHQSQSVIMWASVANDVKCLKVMMTININVIIHINDKKSIMLINGIEMKKWRKKMKWWN